MTDPSQNTLHAPSEFHPIFRAIGLDAEGVFTDPRIVPWRKLPDRENCTLDADPGDGRTVRLHIKRYRPARGFIGLTKSTTPAEEEVKGYRLLERRNIPTAPLAGWGNLADGRSFTLWHDLSGYTPADKLIGSGTPFDLVLGPTADLSAQLHRAGLHHRDLYLCHFMARVTEDGAGGRGVDLKLIDTARVRRLGNVFTRRRWVVKDLAQFWYSMTRLPVTDEQRSSWLERYAEQRGDGTTAAGLRRSVERKAGRIARHDARLNEKHPTRNVSIPKERGGGPSAAANDNS